jgi:hypothetical protein
MPLTLARWKLIAIAAILVAARTAAAQESDDGALDANDPSVCELFESDTATVRGQLVRLTFPGPPNYESVADGDRPVTVYAVVMPSAKCKALENNLFFVQLLQLQDVSAHEAQLASLVGREVEIRGKVNEAELPTHFTGLVMALKSVRAVGRP